MGKKNEVNLRFSMTATDIGLFRKAERDLASIGAVKVSDDGFNSKWMKDGILYTIARAF